MQTHRAGNPQAEHPVPPVEGAAGRLPPRVLGREGTRGPGPTLVVIAGLHGNEPAGVQASRRVLRAVQSRERGFRGRVHFLVGNRQALAAGARYVDRDLNRMWTGERIERLERLVAEEGEPALTPEDREQRELLEGLREILEEAQGPVYVVDLHTTSGPRGIFTTVGDTLENRALALALPVPLVLGLEEQVEGTLQDYLSRLGAVTLLFESGQHLEAEAVDRAEAAIWLLLCATGVLPQTEVPEVDQARTLLGRSGRDLPRALEIRYRHGVAEGDGFRMHPGWMNFAPVRRGEQVAVDRQGPVHAPETGRILMPLYQVQGDDGFFLVREFRPVWLHLSRLLRRVGVDRVVHLFPGIRPHPRRPDALVVNLRVARWYALQFLHLLGFRRYREEDGRLVVLRRVGPGQPETSASRSSG